LTFFLQKNTPDPHMRAQQSQTMHIYISTNAVERDCSRSDVTRDKSIMKTRAITTINSSWQKSATMYVWRRNAWDSSAPCHTQSSTRIWFSNRTKHQVKVCSKWTTIDSVPGWTQNRNVTLLPPKTIFPSMPQTSCTHYWSLISTVRPLFHFAISQARWTR